MADQNSETPVTFTTVQVSVFGPFPERDLPWVTTVTRQTGGFPTGCTIPAATRSDAWSTARAALEDIIAKELDQ